MITPFAAFIARRVARALILIVVVASVAMLLVHLAPGDAVTELELSREAAALQRSRLGLDRPFIVQYTDWLGRLLRLDLGESVTFNRPVADLLTESAGYTLLLGVAALILALGIGVPAGVMTGKGGGGLLSGSISAASLLLLSTPPLVTALLFVLFAARTGWFPTGGMGVTDGQGPFAVLGTFMRHLPLPALALALPIAASLERLQSQAVGEALREPCVTAARARGVSSARVVWVHAFRLSLKPVLGVLGIVIGSTLSGSLIVEMVMGWPGLGTLMLDALEGRDLHLAAGCAASAAALLALGLLASDIALASSDPRILDPA